MNGCVYIWQYALYLTELYMFAIVGLQCSIRLYKHRLPIFLVLLVMWLAI